MTAATACRKCGTQPRAGARFCDGCGASVAEQDARAEYKQVTVMFADVVHSMDIAAAVGAERLREIMTQLADRCAAMVKRYSGTVDKFTGDGIMAVFGAPVALEDHAVRACLVALGIQEEAKRLADDVRECDEVELQLRVGLNSGQVIAGEIGSGTFGYTAVGEQVGMAQRMESVAPAGGVMLSATTARLVEDTATLGELQHVRIKGAEAPVAARQLLGIANTHRTLGRAESHLVGRHWEMSAVAGLLDRAIDGRGAVVGVVGPPGIGKTRLAGEVLALAKVRSVKVFTTFCESHATDVPFGVVSRFLRAIEQLHGLDDQSARTRVRARIPDADPEDILLLDDLLGIADPEVELPKIDPDARRRRLTALINAAQLARTQPAVFAIEDAHWIDEASEFMLADFVSVIPRTHAMVVVTYRPEYHGALARVPGAQSIALAPLSESETATLVGELLGPDPSVGQISEIVAGRAAGNPFFAEEITRELAERGVLIGQRGQYSCRTDAGEVRVPATLQATIAARIDRLGPAAKRTLGAASVIGSLFGADLLASLGIAPSVDELIQAELIDQVRFTPHAEYGFRHPLIRTVAYESQLKSDRAQMHRRLATAIEARDPGSADHNAALIAEHLETAGDLHAAYEWQMRAAAWASNRDILAARLSWERARKIADAMPNTDPDRCHLRIAPRTMLCGTTYRVHGVIAGNGFDELRELCSAAGNKASLAIGMSALVMDYMSQDRMREASELATEAMTLIESIGDPSLTVGLSLPPVLAKIERAEYHDALRWSQRAIDLAEGDPTRGNLLVGSPLAVALAQRAIARYCLGRPGWHDDLRHGLAMARSADPMSYAAVVTYAYFEGIPCGVLRPDDRAIAEIEDALQIAERAGDDFAVSLARSTLGIALVHRTPAAERNRGRKLLTDVSEELQRRGSLRGDVPLMNIYLARERARSGDLEGTVPLLLSTVDQRFGEGQLLQWGILATGVLVETLLEHAAVTDSKEGLGQAETAIDRLAAAPADDGLAIRDIWLMRLRAMHAQACGDDTGYPTYRDRYRDMAKKLGFDGHIAWAEAMV